MTLEEFRNKLKIGDTIVVKANSKYNELEGKVKLKSAGKVVAQMDNGTERTYSYMAIQRKETLWLAES